MPDETTSLRAAPWALPVALLGLAGAVALGGVRATPPRALPRSAPPSEFSAERAIDVLERVLGDGIPHPVGTPENARVRERLIREFEAQGLHPELQETFACAGFPRCAPVVNVLVRVPGREPGPALMVTAHYDSVPAGPGANDDGTAVGTLVEIARALQHGPALRHDLLLLVTDAEEMGLIGAEGFAADHPAMEKVAAVISMESRGSTGPANMFETGPRSADLVRAMADVCPAARGSSAAAAVYERMPNDTDLSVFKRADKPGLNFAYAGNVVHYHSPLDDLAHASADSTQHRGECVLALTRALGDGTLPPADEGDLVFFDVLGFGLVAWREGFTLPLALLGSGAVATAAGLLLRARALAPVAMAWAFAAQLLGAILAVGATMGWVAALRALTGVQAPWTASPLPTLAALVSTSVACTAAVVVLFRRRAGFWGFWAAHWIWGAALALLFAAASPATSPGQVVTVLFAGFACLATGAVTRPDSASRAAASVLLVLPPVALFQLLLALSIHQTLGLGTPLPIALLLWGVVAALAPLLCVTRRPWLLPGSSAALAALATVAALSAEPYSPERPGILNLAFHQDADTGAAHWLADDGTGAIPVALLDAGGFEDGAPLLPFMSSDSFRLRGPAASEPLPGPEVEVLGDTRSAAGTRTLTLRLRSRRGAPQASLVLAPSTAVSDAWINEVHVGPPPKWLRDLMGGWHSYQVVGLPEEGAVIRLELDSSEPVEAIVTDQSYELPASGAALLRARPPTLVPKHGGDQTWVTSRLTL